MAKTKVSKAELQQLERDHRAVTLRRELMGVDYEALTSQHSRIRDRLESAFVEQYVDYRDYLLPRTGFQSRIEDRERGELSPIYRNEKDLSAIRYAGRLLANCNLTGLSILERLTDYVIRTGFVYRVKPADKDDKGSEPLAKIANKVLEDFIEHNNWVNDLDREVFSRTRSEGERFLGLWHEPGTVTEARIIEPDCILEPNNIRGIQNWLGIDDGDWSFGVHTETGDSASIKGYYVQWTPDGHDWDYIPGGNKAFNSGEKCWIDHVKVNVPRTAKRGISDFFPVEQFLQLGHKVVQRTGQGSALQAAIAWIKEVVAGTTQQSAQNTALLNPDATYRKMKQSGYIEDVPVVDYEGGSILTPAPGTQYKAGPLGAGTAAPSFINTYESIMRLVGTRWAMREDMITGSAANNNYASILVAGDPFVLSCESKQSAEVISHKRIMWKVLEFAWMDGKFGSIDWDQLKMLLSINVDAPQIASRDRDKETARRLILNKAGILSKTTWAAQEDLDYEAELELGAEAEAVKEPSQGDPKNKDNVDPKAVSESLQIAREIWKDYP